MLAVALGNGANQIQKSPAECEASNISCRFKKRNRTYLINRRLA